MDYTLIMGNNFISNSPKSIKYYDKNLFSLNRSNKEILISTEIINFDKNVKIVQIKDNKIIFIDNDLNLKNSEKDHILITDNKGEIIFQYRLLDENTILVSGTFDLENQQKLTITQNYIILPTGKWIMHDKINSQEKDIIITNERISI